MQITSYKDLIVWQKSIELVIAVYKYTKTLPEEERFGLTSQMRRAVVSIPSNIAEGYTRYHTNEYVHFLGTSDASAAELDTQLIICTRLSLGNTHFRQECEKILVEVQKMIPAVVKGLRRCSHSPLTPSL